MVLGHTAQFARLRNELTNTEGQMKVRELFDLSGKVALITGGSRGLGLQMAEGARDTLAARPFAGTGA